MTPRTTTSMMIAVLIALALVTTVPAASAFQAKVLVGPTDPSGCTTGEAGPGQTASCSFTCQPQSTISLSASAGGYLDAKATCGGHHAASCSGSGSCSGTGEYDGLGASGSCTITVRSSAESGGSASCGSTGPFADTVDAVVRHGVALGPEVADESA